jgi:hypothetical protein
MGLLSSREGVIFISANAECLRTIGI